MVIHRCVILPGPSIDASSNVEAAGTTTLGETFQPRPRSRAARAPVPSVARPPPPGEPSKFSGLMERVRTLRRVDTEESPPLVTVSNVAANRKPGPHMGLAMPRPRRRDERVQTL